MSCGNLMIVFATCESFMPNSFNHCTLGFKFSSRLQPMICGKVMIVFATCKSSMPNSFNHCTLGFKCSSRR
eukprot:CAMPEP_0204111690 /NCGR_PEP_ID=MMETSP0361-20130328/2619_1 /ASSEMBLY_ACC=CAM_ASM_000343 /TAXON_ID=268821 /ORGANISM="Scrippsiella Hangoei, Strain SHTV-5" /LENGTH=70 /DNA_ID=CAMNT_0051061779 /DNA_START=205 /DNA_END=417 /DNA_ORIENTATION=-